jgi:ubiquinone/menaquinone biosynthesis C-methylase UbiE
MQTVDRRFFPLGPGDRVLDLGCGEGRHAIAVSAVDGADAVGLDLALEDLATAREKMREFRALLEDPDTQAAATVPTRKALFGLLAGDALHLPFADASFDAVICSEVLEHIPDYGPVLQEMHRVLRPGGMLCVSVPRAWPERICWFLSREYHEVPGGHVRIFSRRQLRTEIEAAGVECYREHGAHALHSPYWWLQCLFWKQRENNWLIRQYHRLLVWDMMERPALTRSLERLLNPVLGKSVVMYFRKPAAES